MKIESHCDGNVLIVEDFLSQEEIKKVDDLMRNFNYDGLIEHDFAYWGKRLLNEYQVTLTPGYEKSLDEIKPIISDIKDRVSSFLNENDHVDNWEPASPNLIRMYPNSSPIEFGGDKELEMFVHIDNQGHMEKPIMWGAVVYPNDDYTGGEIYYPDYNFSYKPKAGSMVLHDGNTRHGVKKVIEGNRFCMASLVTIQGNYNQNPLPTRTDNPIAPYHYPAGYWGKRMPDDPIQEDVKNPRGDGSFAPYNDSPVLGRADGNM